MFFLEDSMISVYETSGFPHPSFHLPKSLQYSRFSVRNNQSRWLN